jgi:hydroxypyruvate isomerase
MERREFLGALTAPLIVAGASSGQTPPQTPAQAPAAAPAPFQPFASTVPPPRKGRLKQGVTNGVFGRNAREDAVFEDNCKEAARLGIVAYDLVGPDRWPILKKYGLVPSMYPGGPGGTIAEALNNKANHDRLRPLMHAAIDAAAANGVPNIITFSGNRKGMADAEGADNCVAFLETVKAHAEDKQVTICMEYLNSKVNHKDYMFDSIDWGVGVMKRVNSPRVKILYDIYHAQIMDGDIVRNIRDHYQWIGHFHTGGNPGRKEIDDTQELNYRFIMKAIADLGFTGYVTHEYSPTTGNDAIKELAKAMEICAV